MSAVIEERVVISLTEARDRGLTRYFTGEPCDRGHLAERRTASRICVVCSRIACAESKAKRRQNGIPQRTEVLPELPYVIPPWETWQEQPNISLVVAKAKWMVSIAGEEQRASLARLRKLWSEERAQREEQHPPINWVERAIRFDAQAERKRINREEVEAQPQREPSEPVIISREEACAKGLTHYFIGERCYAGHRSVRYVNNNRCRECHVSGREGRPRKRGRPPRSLPPIHNEGFTSDPPRWPDDGGKLRVPIYDLNFGQSRLVRRVGWTNCLGREPVHRIFSSDITRERMCANCKRLQDRGTIDD